MYTQVGVIINTHGIKGGLKIYPYTFDVNRFNEYKQLYIGDNKELVNIQSASFYKNLVILTFEEYNNINDVLKFKDSNIYIKSEDEAILDIGSYYIDDIVGCEVYDESMNYFGKVTEVVQGASNDVYIVEGDKIRGLLPAIKEFIKKVDITEKKMIISPIDGMFDEI